MFRPKNRNRVQLSCDPNFGRTRQAHKTEVDINRIVARYKKSGTPFLMPGQKPVFADVTNIRDFTSAANFLLDARREFLSLPATVRRRFENNPDKLVAFLDDEKNLTEAVELGLVKAPAPDKAPDLNPTPSGGDGNSKPNS